MLDTVLLIILIIVVLGSAVWLRWDMKDIRTTISALRSRVANLEGTDLPEPAVFDARTPQEVKEHKFEDDGESAVIQAKTPAQLAKERDRKLNEELDRLAGRRP